MNPETKEETKQAPANQPAPGSTAQSTETPAASKTQAGDDFRAKYEAATEQAKKVQKDFAALEKAHKDTLKSIEDGSLIGKVLAEKFGTKQDEDPAKVLERVRADQEKFTAENAALRSKLREYAVLETLRELAPDAHKVSRLVPLMDLSEVEVKDGKVENVDAIKEGLDALRKSDPYLFVTAQEKQAAADKGRGSPLPPAPPPPDADATPSQKPAPAKVRAGIMSLPHLQRH